MSEPTPRTDAVTGKEYHLVDCYVDAQLRAGALAKVARQLERELYSMRQSYETCVAAIKAELATAQAELVECRREMRRNHYIRRSAKL